jgi:hypothetical protein
VRKNAKTRREKEDRKIRRQSLRMKDWMRRNK